MLIERAPSIKGLGGNSRRVKTNILLLMVLFMAVFFLLTLSLLNLSLIRARKTAELPVPGTAAQELAKPAIQKKTISVSSGDTLIKLLTGQGLDTEIAHMAITALKKVFNPRQLQNGQEITMAFETPENSDPLFHSLSIKLDATREVQVTRSSVNDFVSKEIIYELDAKPALARAKINSNLYNAAIEAGMPLDVLIRMIRAYSYDVDFQRDIRPGDTFEALYEKMLDKDGNFIQGGSILYASLNTNDRTLFVYRYQTADGEVDLYNEKGQSVRKTLMITPIDGARLSSKYGMRRHPILGYSRMHKGLDFAAPYGTPIMAAGDGVVEYAGRNGGYGKYIRIRHANEYKTVFGHMSRFAQGISNGVRVKQGEIIGYVGSTGISTGPHLHYEVLYNGKSINPSSISTSPGRILKGEELERFLQAKRELETLYASLEKGKKTARLD
jgi:murein DD-endopeptidase MepM/ murein hydrolase activator NlpD